MVTRKVMGRSVRGWAPLMALCPGHVCPGGAWSGVLFPEVGAAEGGAADLPSEERTPQHAAELYFFFIFIF